MLENENKTAKELNDILQNKGEEIPELRTIITISVNRDNQLVVAAPMNNPKLCLHAYADALKVLADLMGEKPRVVVPRG